MPGKQAKVVTPPMLKRMLRRVSRSSFPARSRGPEQRTQAAPTIPGLRNARGRRAVGAATHGSRTCSGSARTASGSVGASFAKPGRWRTGVAGCMAALRRVRSRLMKVPDRAFECALGMSPAALAEYAEAASRIPAALEATAPGQPQPVFNFILGSNSRGRPSGSQERNSPR